MKKNVKRWLTVILIGFLGTACTMIYLLATDRLMSREATEVFALEGTFDTLEVRTVRAGVEVVPTSDAPKVEVYAKAWLPESIKLKEHVEWSVQQGKLAITEIPFPDTFLGLFPQPYEMYMTVYVPESVYMAYLGGNK